MEELLNKITPNLLQLKRFIVGKAAQELSSLSQPCYFPKTKKFYYEILNILKITDKDVKEYIKRILKGTGAEGRLLAKEPASNLLVFVMHLFLKNGDNAAYSATMVYFLIVHYSRLMHKSLPNYCDEDTFKYTLDTLTKTHLFAREKTISNTLFYLSQAIQKRFTEDIKKWNLEKVILFMAETRTRISQSVKSFAQNYYRNKEEGGAIKTQNEETDDEANAYQYKVLQKGQKVVEEVARKITTYKVVDRKALDDAKNVSKVKTSIAILIANEVTNEKYFNNIKILLQLYVKGLTNVKMICGDEYYTHVKKLMELKRTSAQLYFKGQVNVLLIEILKSLKLTNTYKSYTSQTQFIINSFLAFYITSFLRNNLC